MRKKNRPSQYGKQLSLFPQQVVSLRPAEQLSNGITKHSDGESTFFSLLERNRSLTTNLLERILCTGNLLRAYRSVCSNAGSSGIDGMTTQDLGNWWLSGIDDLCNGIFEERYHPSAVLGVEIPKANGGKRLLGIPTVIDRLIQQAIQQELSLYYEPLFSEHSYGFRPKRSTHQAIQQASEYISAGYNWVVDLDLANFFDKINHDRLMQRLSKGIGDKRLLRLIRKYLRSDIMLGGLSEQRLSGSPQGSPLSPLLSNIVLDELDKELEKRGHLFVRYADDCNIYVKSQKAGERVLQSITRFIESKLKLKVNQEKSGVRRCDQVRFLGHTIMPTGKIRISDKSRKSFKQRIIKITKRNRGVAFKTVIAEVNQYTKGWVNYYRLSNCWHPWRELDARIRQRLRIYRLKQCGRKYTTCKFLRKLGVEEISAWAALKHSQNWCSLSYKAVVKGAMSNLWFEKQGLHTLSSLHAKWLKD